MSMLQTWMTRLLPMASFFIKLSSSFPKSTMLCTSRSTTKQGQSRLPQKVSQGKPSQTSVRGRSVTCGDTYFFSFSSPTSTGSQVLDPIKNPYYNLVVSVKDMGGQNENSFSDTTSVDITVRENIWKAPEPVEIRENLTDPHPIKITQVVSK